MAARRGTCTERCEYSREWQKNKEENESLGDMPYDLESGVGIISDAHLRKTDLEGIYSARPQLSACEQFLTLITWAIPPDAHLVNNSIWQLQFPLTLIT